MRETEKKYQCIPFWSWNDELDEKGLVDQVEWMNDNGVGGFFMHARGGLNRRRSVKINGESTNDSRCKLFFYQRRNTTKIGL